MDSVMSKEALRSTFRVRRSALSKEERARTDLRIASRLLELPEVVRADCVFTYLSFGSEVDTRFVITRCWEMGKRVCLPRCAAGYTLTWHAVEDLDHLVRSRFGMEEPAAGAPQAQPAGSVYSVALVPGLAFDRRGFRLGYGGGYYDRFLPAFSGVSIGLCRSDLLSDELPSLSEYDYPVDLVVTDNEAIRPAAPLVR